MTTPTLKDAARALQVAWDAIETLPPLELTEAEATDLVGAILFSIRPPDREDLPLRQLEARDYIDGILKG